MESHEAAFCVWLLPLNAVAVAVALRCAAGRSFRRCDALYPLSCPRTLNSFPFSMMNITAMNALALVFWRILGLSLWRVPSRGVSAHGQARGRNQG